MTFLRLLLRNLLYHWRGNFAVFLGIALGSAVLTGALLVGDSLRGSLKALTLDQLGWVDHAMLPGRFFRAQLAYDITAVSRAPVLLLQGSAIRKGSSERVGKVTVLGIDASFWPKEAVPESEAFWTTDEAGVVLNQTLARALGVDVGDSIELNVPKANNVPSETLMGQRKADRVIDSIDVKVRKIVPDAGMGRFSLKPSPEPVRNAFVPIRLLQRRLDLEGRANAILTAGTTPEVRQHLKLDDWGLRFRSPKDRAEAFFNLLAGPSGRTEIPKKGKGWLDSSGPKPVSRIPDRLVEAAEKNRGLLTKDIVIAYYQEARKYHVLESRRMLLEPFVVDAVHRLTPERKDPDAKPRWLVTPILIYLADTLSDGKREVPYSIIASDDTTFLDKNGKEQFVLADDEILLTTWAGSPWEKKAPAKLTLLYEAPNETNKLVKKVETFRVRPGLEPIVGMFDDPDFTPEVRGVTDKLDISTWETPPFDFNPKRNSQADKDFSVRYRTTPRAYVNLKKAQELWGNRFGNLTSIRFEMGTDRAEDVPERLLKELDPKQGGFEFLPVRDDAIKASSGTIDFGLYFIYFSFFLIVSALLLVGLLVRLNLDRRAGEMGLLLATGWDHGRVQRLLLGEAAVLAVVGTLTGLAGAMIYAHFMLKLLASQWPGGDSLNFLSLHVGPASLVIGFTVSMLVSLVTLWWATRVLGKLTPRALLSGETTQAVGRADAGPGWSRWLVPLGVLGALGLAITARFLPSNEAQTFSFFGGGALLLTACLAGVWNGLKWTNRAHSPQPSLLRLGLRNAGRHAVRSVLTVGLLAAASFLIVAVESFHKETGQRFAEKTGGSGGFALYAEGNVPIYEDLNDPAVRSRRDIKLDTPQMRRVEIFPCRVQPGDDTSCLNLYKPLKPRVMGVSAKFIKRSGLHFGASAAESKEERTNPWLLLQGSTDDGIPAIIDANTATYILKVDVGGIVEVKNDQGKQVKLRIVALLEESMFQSEILIAEENFLKLYPTQQGFSFLLIDTENADVEQVAAIQSQLGKALEGYNLDVLTTASRLQGYLAVETMYLATFQALGGLGLILGAVGLAIVLLRGVWERRAELALLQALGFRAGQLAWLVLVENTFLLVLGLASGTVSALLAVAPHLVGSGAQVLWLRIAQLLALVLAVGLLSAALAVWSTLKTPVLTALRRE